MNKLDDILPSAWRKHRPDALDLVPTIIDREPNLTEVGTKIADKDQCASRLVPTVPMVPTISEGIQERAGPPEWWEPSEVRYAAWRELASELEKRFEINQEAAELEATRQLGYGFFDWD